MEYNTKFNIGDHCWCMNANQAKECEIKKISVINFKDANYDETYSVRYDVSFADSYGTEKEDDLFTTKSALIRSL